AAIEAIQQLLREKRMTSPQLAEALGLHASTTFNYLRHMAKTLHLVRRTDKMDRPNGSFYWELGAEILLVELDEKEDPRYAPKRKIVQAYQIGIPRDPMIAALFGPATQ